MSAHVLHLPPDRVELTLTADRRDSVLSVTHVLTRGEAYALAAKLIDCPLERLPGYVPVGYLPTYCGARDGYHPAHYWALGQLWCAGEPT